MWAERLGCPEARDGRAIRARRRCRQPDRHAVQFGTFELDPCSGELKRNGRRVPLQDQPARALCLLASRPGQLVTRDELRQALWSADTFLEFDTALNIVVTKVRHALGDVAASPRFIETVPKRGYRFIADVRRADGTTPATSDSRAARGPWSLSGSIGPPELAARACRPRPSTRWLAAALLLAGVSAATSRFWRPDSDAAAGRACGDASSR